MDQVSQRREIVGRNYSVIRNAAIFMAEIGIRPNWISIASIGFAGLAGVAMVFLGLQTNWAWAAAALCGILFRGLCNIWDGLVAIECQKASSDGGFFNEAPDRLSDSLLLIGAGLAWRMDSSGLAIGLAAALAAGMVAYVRALSSNLTSKADFSGIMSKPYRMVVLALSILASLIWGPDAFFPGLITIIVGCVISCATRSYSTIKTLNA